MEGDTLFATADDSFDASQHVRLGDALVCYTVFSAFDSLS